MGTDLQIQSSKKGKQENFRNTLVEILHCFLQERIACMWKYSCYCSTYVAHFCNNLNLDSGSTLEIVLFTCQIRFLFLITDCGGMEYQLPNAEPSGLPIISNTMASTNNWKKNSIYLGPYLAWSKSTIENYLSPKYIKTDNE